jgi:hypothetical protein
MGGSFGSTAEGQIRLKTFFYPFAQFESATLSIEPICGLTGKSQQTIRNRVSTETFPCATGDGL